MRRPLWKRVWYRLTQYVAGAAFRVWFRLRREGHRAVPMDGPAVFVCNHQSHLDPVIVGVMCRRQIAYLARDTLFTGPLGVLIRSYDAVPIDREGTGLAGIRATLKRIKQGDAVLLFPEGTRTGDGALQPLQPGFLALVRRGKAAIVPVAVDGPYRAMPRGAVLPKPVRVGLCYGQAIPVEESSGLDDAALLALVEERIRLCLRRASQLAGR
ncbi:MAG: lysophospholipid acyltransferase family protein [Planctomycetota bacterium]